MAEYEIIINLDIWMGKPLNILAVPVEMVQLKDFFLKLLFRFIEVAIHPHWCLYEGYLK